MTTLKAIDILALTIEFYHWWLMFLAQMAQMALFIYPLHNSRVRHCEYYSLVKIQVSLKSGCFQNVQKLFFEIKVWFQDWLEIKVKIMSWLENCGVWRKYSCCPCQSRFHVSCSGRHILWGNKSLFSFLRVLRLNPTAGHCRTDSNRRGLQLTTGNTSITCCSRRAVHPSFA